MSTTVLVSMNDQQLSELIESSLRRVLESKPEATADTSDTLLDTKEVARLTKYKETFQHESRQGDASVIFQFLGHIFGEQIEMGYDYFKILLERPTQILPILCLVSEERGTGKTTFLHFIKSIFGENMTINSNEGFRSNFNIEWAQIPFFLHFLVSRDFFHPSKTRMWFTADQIATPALKKLLNQNRNKLEVEIAHILLTIADEKELDEIRFCTGDVQDWLNKKHIRFKDLSQIKRILQSAWKLSPASNSLTYPQYKFLTDGSVFEQTGKDRFYTLSRRRINELNELP